MKLTLNVLSDEAFSLVSTRSPAVLKYRSLGMRVAGAEGQRAAVALSCQQTTGYDRLILILSAGMFQPEIQKFISYSPHPQSFARSAELADCCAWSCMAFHEVF